MASVPTNLERCLLALSESKSTLSVKVDFTRIADFLIIGDHRGFTLIG